VILRPWNAEAFKEYARPLEKLEKNLRKCGYPVILYAHLDTFGSKYVRVISPGSKKKHVCIEGASPLQAVMGVVARVRL